MSFVEESQAFVEVRELLDAVRRPVMQALDDPTKCAELNASKGKAEKCSRFYRQEYAFAFDTIRRKRSVQM